MPGKQAAAVAQALPAAAAATVAVAPESALQLRLGSIKDLVQ